MISLLNIFKIYTHFMSSAFALRIVFETVNSSSVNRSRRPSFIELIRKVYFLIFIWNLLYLFTHIDKYEHFVYISFLSICTRIYVIYILHIYPYTISTCMYVFSHTHMFITHKHNFSQTSASDFLVSSLRLWLAFPTQELGSILVLK